MLIAAMDADSSLASAPADALLKELAARLDRRLELVIRPEVAIREGLASAGPGGGGGSARYSRSNEDVRALSACCASRTTQGDAMSMFLTQEELVTLTARKKKNLQIEQLRKMGTPVFVNAGMLQWSPAWPLRDGRQRLSRLPKYLRCRTCSVVYEVNAFNPLARPVPSFWLQIMRLNSVKQTNSR